MQLKRGPAAPAIAAAVFLRLPPANADLGRSRVIEKLMSRLALLAAACTLAGATPAAADDKLATLRLD